eukprot:CAMPEP_0116045954 /NCGR_PEP_ID=MMETSP0321-20121206/27943_1 /TAXON_ID=163516 /ORGANISM="Leptocylindrus danicus var. danicus, Strain B650" /LENGTH=968 /DNA_ID=CAMNT_0003527421 /DNA_START=13 /DNA_END=2919 /DNA_ORIENTATION=+
MDGEEGQVEESEHDSDDDEETYHDRSSIDTSSIIEGKRKRKNISYYEGPTVFYTKSQRRNKWGNIASNRGGVGVAKKRRRKKRKYGRHSLDGQTMATSENGSVLAEDGSVASSIVSNITDVFGGVAVPHTWPKKRRRNAGIVDSGDDDYDDDAVLMSKDDDASDEFEKPQELHKKEKGNSPPDRNYRQLANGENDDQVSRAEMHRYMEAKKTKKKKRRSYNKVDRSYRPGKYDSEASDDDELDDSLFKSSSGRKSRKKRRSKSTADNQNNLHYEDEQEEEDDSLVAQNASAEIAKKQRRRRSKVGESYMSASDDETDDKEDENGFDSDKSVFAGYHGVKKEKAKKKKKRRSNVDTTYRPAADGCSDDSDDVLINRKKRSRRKRRRTNSAAENCVVSNVDEKDNTPELLRVEQKPVVALRVEQKPPEAPIGPSVTTFPISAMEMEKYEQKELDSTKLRENNRNGDYVIAAGTRSGDQVAFTKTSTWFFIFSLIYAAVYLIVFKLDGGTTLPLSRKQIESVQPPPVNDIELMSEKDEDIQTNTMLDDCVVEDVREPDNSNEVGEIEIMSSFLDLPEENPEDHSVQPDFDVQELVDGSIQDLLASETIAGSVLHGVEVMDKMSTVMRQWNDDLFQNENDASIANRLIDSESVFPALSNLQLVTQQTLDSISKIRQSAIEMESEDKIVDTNAFDAAHLKFSELAWSTKTDLISKNSLLMEGIENILLEEDIIPQIDELSNEGTVLELLIDEKGEDAVESIDKLSVKSVQSFAIDALDEVNESHDYASLDDGASLVYEGLYQTSQSLVDELPVGNRFLSSMGLKDYGYRANAALSSTFGESLLGQCWAFRKTPSRKEYEPLSGLLGNLVVRLSSPITVRHVVVEHPPKHVTPRSESAIKEFRIIGFEDPECVKNPSLLGSFMYDIDAPYSHQSFLIRETDSNGGARPKQSCIMLAIDSNWGHDYSCLYRFRVH